MEWNMDGTLPTMRPMLLDDDRSRQQTSAVRCSSCRTLMDRRRASSPPSAMRGRGRRGLLIPALAALSGLAAAATADASMIDLGGWADDPYPLDERRPLDEHRNSGGGLRRTRRRAEDADADHTRRGMELFDLLTDTPPRTDSDDCDPSTQHSLRFKFYADGDSRSAGDGGWSVSSSAHGTRIDGGTMAAGNFGHGAVVERRVCADKVDPAGTYAGYFEKKEHDAVSSAVGSCYDTVLDGTKKGGKTSRSRRGGGSGGSFALLMDGVEVATHTGGRGKSSGFEKCAFRACATSDGGHHTLSNLAGSDCELVEPKCDEAYHKERLVKVELKTDSKASDETSWELRKSDAHASPMLDAATDNELLMAGGSPVYDSDGSAWMGKSGVGVEFAGPPGQKFASTTCMSAAESRENNGGCYDFRARDSRGDGLRDGDGSIKVTVGRTRLVERDDEWAYCAVRVCADGTVRGLQGNQCEFGRGPGLVDRINDGMDPLLDEMRAFDFGFWPDAEEAEAPLPPIATDQEFDEEGTYEEDGPVRPLPTAPPPEELVSNPPKEAMWYSVEYEEGKRYCRYDAHYPSQLLKASMSGLLHGTREMCCYANLGACPDYPALDDPEDLETTEGDLFEYLSFVKSRPSRGRAGELVEEETIEETVEETVEEIDPSSDDGYVTTEEGMKYQVTHPPIDAGSPSPARAQWVRTRYTLWVNGFPEDTPSARLVDSSRDTPFAFVAGVSQVIRGWDLAILDMKLGEVRKLVIPPELGYGERSGGAIPPNSTLYFMVMLTEIGPMPSLSAEQQKWMEDNSL